MLGYDLAPARACVLGDEKDGRLGAGLGEEAGHWLGESSGMREAQGAGAPQGGNLTKLHPQGAGHMVPTDKPEAALTMFSRFLNKQPY